MAEGRADPAYLHEVDGEWREVTWREADEAVGELANGLLALGVAQGTVVRAARADEPRVGALRLRPRARRRRRGADLLVELGARRAVRARALAVRRRPRRGRGAAREGRGRRARPRHLVRRARRSARARPCVRGRSSERARRARRLDRRGRPLHVHLHVGDDRPAEGLHDPAPQLLRDGPEGRRDGAPADHARRPHAALPPAGAQLRAAPAPVGALRRFLDRVPRRSDARRGRTAARAPHALSERAPRLREDPRRRRREVRRGGRRSPQADRLVARRRQARLDAPPGEAARAARRSPCSTASPTSSSTRR